MTHWLKTKIPLKKKKQRFRFARKDEKGRSHLFVLRYNVWLYIVTRVYYQNGNSISWIKFVLKKRKTSKKP